MFRLLSLMLSRITQKKVTAITLVKDLGQELRPEGTVRGQYVRAGSSAAIQQHGAEWLLSDPKAAIADGSNERPLMAEGCLSPASEKRSIV